ncbi:MAG: xanthine phosphoribosyltransferase [Eubacteriales bacterium]
MKALEDKILKEGKVYPGNVLNVSGFLNHKIDTEFLFSIGREISELFRGCGVTKILTVEASGIAIAVAAAMYMHVPVVFAKKNNTNNLTAEKYTASVKSYTHRRVYEIVVAKECITKEDRILIVDDFLAHGSALEGLIEIINQSGASLIGAAIAIEKGFQGGGDKLRSRGIRVKSLAIIDKMDENRIVYRS